MKVQNAILGDEKITEREEAGLVAGYVLNDILTEGLEKKRKILIGTIALGGVLILLGIYMLTSGSATVGVGAFVAGASAAGGGWMYADKKEPEVEIKNLEKRYWTGYVLDQEGGRMLYDATGALPNSKFELERLNDYEGLHDSVESFDRSFDLPVVLPEDENVENKVRSELEGVRNKLSDTEKRTIEAPVIDEDDEVLDAIDEVAEHAVEGKRDTDVIEVEVEEAEEEVKEIEKMETLAFEEDPEETLNDLKDNTEETVEKLTTEQEEMVERLNSHIEFAGETLALISYNFYCPDCVEDDVYSELDLSFNDGPEWFCETCRESFTPEDDPVPKNRVKDELVEDIWDDLWIEKDDQRRKVYENIEDQKEELKEKEFEQKKEEIRTAWDRIKDVRSKIRDLKTEAEAKKGAIQEIGEVMNKYDRLAQERKEEFEKDVREAAERIDKETEEIIEEMRAYEEKKLQEAEEESKQRAEVLRAEERKRHQEKVAKMEEIQETQEEHFKKQELLETYGKVSAFDTINKFRRMKMSALGMSKKD